MIEMEDSALSPLRRSTRTRTPAHKEQPKETTRSTDRPREKRKREERHSDFNEEENIILMDMEPMPKMKHVSPLEEALHIVSKAVDTPEDKLDVVIRDTISTMGTPANRVRFSQKFVQEMMNYGQDGLSSSDDMDYSGSRKKPRNSCMDIVHSLSNGNQIAGELTGPGSIPDNHPMKPFVEHSDKEMSVKEALALGFLNYRVRMKRTKSSPDDESLSRVYGSSGQMEDNSGSPSPIPSSNNIIQDMVNIATTQAGTGSSSWDESWGVEFPTAGDSSQSTPNASNSPDENAGGSGNSLLDVDDEPVEQLSSSDYPLPPFIDIPLDISKGYKGGYYVVGVKYVLFSTLIDKGKMVVPLRHQIPLSINGRTVRMSLFDLLEANGIVINDPDNCYHISRMFDLTSLLINATMASYLSLVPNRNNDAHFHAYHNKRPFVVSEDKPPLTIYRRDYFLGVVRSGSVMSFGDNHIFGSKTNSSDVKPTLNLDDLTANVDFVHHDDSLLGIPSGSRKKLTVKQCLMVIAANDAGMTLKDVATKFGIQMATLQHILLIRNEVIRARAMQYLKESESEEAKRLTEDFHAKIKRTSLMGLNILVWRFFDDCRGEDIHITNRMLKAHAGTLAKYMELTHFKCSEGWLDAFKRRHGIDLKAMKGDPLTLEFELNYDDNSIFVDEGDLGGSGHGHNDGEHINESINGPSNGDDPCSVTAALLESVEKAMGGEDEENAPTNRLKELEQSHMTFEPENETFEPANSTRGTVDIGDTKPLDLSHFVHNMLNSSGQYAGAIDTTSPTNDVSERMERDDRSLVANIVKSAAIHVHDKEVQYALDTLRSFLLSREPEAVKLLLPLQEKLSTLCGETSNE